MKYKAEVIRLVYSTTDLEVEANSPEEAEEKLLALGKTQMFNYRSVEYIVDEIQEVEDN